MKRTKGIIIAMVCALIVVAYSLTSIAEDRDPLLDLLIEKGIITEQEASSIEAEVKQRKEAKSTERVASPSTMNKELPFSFSGQVRFRGEAKNNVGPDATETGFVGQRLRLNIDGVSGESKYFVQIQDTRLWGAEQLTSAGASADNTDLHQGYIQLGGDDYSLRIGRQEVNLGDQRLLGAFGWSNNGRSFDGIRLTTPAFNAGELDTYLLKTATTARESTLFGLVYNWKNVKNWKPTLYFLHKDAAGGDTLALGHISKVTFNNAFSGDLELVLEDGNSAGADLSAYAFHIGVKYVRPETKNFWVGLEYNLASGDDGTGADVETFDQIMPTNHNKYGFIDYQGWKNMENIRLNIGGAFSDRTKGNLDIHLFDLNESKDAWYGASGAANTFAGVAMKDATGASGDDVGTEIDLTVNHTITKSLLLEGGYSRFITGDFVDNVLAGAGVKSDDADWLYIQLLKNF